MWPGAARDRAWRRNAAKAASSALAGHDARGDLGDRRADGLGDEGHGARGARVDLEHEDRAVLDGVLHVHQAADIQRLGQRRGLALQLVDGLVRQRMHRQRAGAVARMDAGLLDVLHDAGDEGRPCRRERQSTSTSMASVEIGVEQQRVLAEQRVDLAGLVVRVFLLDVLRHQAGHGVEQVGLQHALVMDDLHGAAAEHIGRAHDQREAELAGDEARLLDRIGDAVLRLRRGRASCSSFWKRSRSSARSIMSGEVPRIGMPAFSSASASFSGVWPPNWTMTPTQLARRLLGAQDLQHVLGRQRLEIEPVRGVVVGRHGLRIAVDHDRFDSRHRAARRRRGSSNSRTRCPGRCGSGRRRG